MGSVVVAHGLSCPETGGIFSKIRTGLTPMSLLWQAGSYPLYHQGSLGVGIVMPVSQMTKLRLREGRDCP